MYNTSRYQYEWRAHYSCYTSVRIYQALERFGTSKDTQIK